ncbi:carboxypeptidase-like regulatory domain-containing protein [Hymenobacter ginsengisoli]|uniref:Carboxypeptidase-like regulatory domain-containing protein n=1 Tax=Hymenobacter ginsengisoli TaxID=1051626 RepID=A0ABP8QUU4_9BACT
MRDARTQKPLAYASVFFANSTYGTTTDSTGHFVLDGIPDAQYELVASYVGYQLYKKQLEVSAAATLTILLQPSPTQLDEVVVRPRKNRPSDYQKFLVQFLGNSALSRQCRIENPEDVVVVYDEGHRELTAVAPRNLRVLNQALGYRITYYNFDFKVFYRDNRCEFVGAPRFEELNSVDARQQQRWSESRRQAYAGSLPHFLRSVRENSLAENGFLVQRMVRELSSTEARQRLAQPNDSLAAVLEPEPGLLARVYSQPLQAAQVCRSEGNPARTRLLFANSLQVTYQREQPDDMYVAYVTETRSNNLKDALANRWLGGQTKTALGKALYEPVLEQSQLRLLGPDAIILPNGYLTNPLSVKVDGYWSFERIGEALPLDYTPAPLK